MKKNQIEITIPFHLVKIIISCFILFISCQQNSNLIIKSNQSVEDSISIYIANVDDKSLTMDLKKEYVYKAYQRTNGMADSVKLKYLDRIGSSFYKLQVNEMYKVINQQILDLSKKNHDTIKIARAFWKLGFYYHNIHQNDSAFFYYTAAYKSYTTLNDEIYAGRMLLNMAIIQENVKDYTGSEINTIKAISKLRNSKQYRSLYLAHNLLGVVYKNLNRFELAIQQNRIAIDYLKKYNNQGWLEATSLNNIGRIYVKEKDFLKSIKYFKEALKIEDLFKTRPQTFAIIIDNLAYSKFKLGDEAELPELFYESLKIRDSLHINDGIAESNLHLSEYFLSKKDTIKAFKFAENAMDNAQKVDYNDGLLESYVLLSKLEPGEKGKAYLNKYIKLSDSLQQKEREIREKFTRIAYETEEVEKENEVITKKNGQLIILIVVGAALSTMVFVYIRQRSKNKELIFNQKQEEANTEIYNLMISEKLKFQEGSLKERVRISEELHDNIVNKLFGTRLALSLINSGIPEDEISEWEGHIESLRELEEEIRTLSHDLKVEVFNIGNTFEKMVEELVEKRSKLSNFELELVFDNVTDWENISNKIKIHCYRTLQETLHNILKYANATKVSIRFYEINEVLYFEIIDNGNGFDPKNKTKGIGLKNIESRIKKLNGEVKFISSPGSGTKIDMTIPLNS